MRNPSGLEPKRALGIVPHAPEERENAYLYLLVFEIFEFLQEITIRKRLVGLGFEHL
jgi:hypothetical protein